jgi:hypothetical protein
MQDFLSGFVGRPCDCDHLPRTFSRVDLFCRTRDAHRANCALRKVLEESRALDSECLVRRLKRAKDALRIEESKRCLCWH